MLRYLNLLIPLALYFTTTKSTFVSHTSNLPTQVSDSSNVISLDILDDTAFDMRYQTNCTDCKCFVQTPVLTYQKQTDAPLTGPAILSSLSAGKLFIAQSSSYSIYQISPPNTLFESVLDASLQGLSGYPNITFSAHDNALAGYNNGWMIVATIDSQGGVQITTYTYSYPSGVTQSSEVYDLAYSGSKFFLAKGNQGLEILTVEAQTQTDMVRLSLDDLEVEQGFEVRKLAVDSDNQVLYIYYPDSNYSTVVALDFSTPAQISLIGNFELGVKQIKQVLVSENKLHVVNKNDNGTYNYIEFLRNTEDIYDEPEMIKFWQISKEILNIQLLDDDNVLIETSDYLYVIRNDLPFETKISQLLVNIIHKQGTGIFTVFQGTSIYVLNIDNDNLLLNLYSAPFENPSLKCGIYKQDGGDYTGTVPFTVDIYRDSCDDAPTKSDDNTCLDHYVFDADFHGNTVIPFDTDLFSLAPAPVSLSTSTPETEVPEEPETSEPSTGGEQPTGPVETPETPETPTNTTEPTTEPSTGGEGGSTGPGSSEPAPSGSTNTTETSEPSTGTSGEGQNNEGPGEETPETSTNTTGTGTTTGPSTPETPANNTGTGGSTGPTKAPADTNEPVDSGNSANNQTETNKTSSSSEDGGLIKKPDLIDPDAPYYDKIDNMYILVVVGLIVVTCFGCVVKCLWDFATRSRRRIAQQFEHKELEEEEEGEGGDQDIEQGSKYKSKGTDEESVSQGE